MKKILSHIKIYVLIIIGFCLILIVPVMVYRAFSTPKSTRLLMAEEEISIEWQWYKLTANKILYAAMPSLLGISTLLVSVLFGLSCVRKRSVHTARIGKHSEIPVHYKDLRDFYPIAVNLSLAEIEASVSNSHDKAFQISGEILKSLASCSRAFKPNSGLPSHIALPSPSTDPIVPVPTFRDILDALEPGEPMVLGFEYESHKPITGSFKRIYSCGIFGLSGSGKTTGLYSIISQSLLLYPEIKYIVIDPHAQKKEGLTKGLPKTAHFEHLDPLNVRPGLMRFIHEMEQRLKNGQDYSHAPCILLIDELPVVMRGSQGRAVEAVLGRVAAEGRGVAVYALISGQDTRLKAAGGNRDLLTSQIAYNLKKKQARYLFDDADIVDLHKVVRESKEPGLCVFAPTDDQPVVMKQPLCTPQDVLYVTQLVSNDNSAANYSTQNTTFDRIDTNETDMSDVMETGETALETTEISLQDDVKLHLERTGTTQNELADSLQISRKDMSYFLNEKPMSNEKRNSIETLLRSAIFEKKRESRNSETLGDKAETSNETEPNSSNVIPFFKK